VALGLLFGLLASLAVTQLLASQLFGITPRDPATFIAVSALLAGVSVLACFFPARRAMRVAPAEALRLD
jgi:ABC-type antimicrobial peptide transport system permease subunit